jgi:polyhydroxyalkanoate synthesis regulator phasin
MPAPKSSSGGSRAASAQKSTATGARNAAGRTSTQANSPAWATADTGAQAHKRSGGTIGGVGDSLATLTEQLVNRIVKPLDLVLLTRERIQETLDQAAERGRVTRTDANELVAELVRLGRQQTDEIFKDVEVLVRRGRDQLESATRRAPRDEPFDRLVRGADRARGAVGVGPSFPILGYDELTAGQVADRVKGLAPAELRKVREYERRHANRKSVLAAIDKVLA